MPAVQLHQLLHGYRSGHGQIAASIRLPESDSELITRLSDLSGSLSSGLQLDSYLTVYPLPSRKFFAVARTWPDPEAPRAGCVLTHTLLFPVDVWAGYKNLRAVNSFFRNPRSMPDHNFSETFRLPNAGPERPPADLKLDPTASRYFVSRYFGKSIRPVVWFNADQPDEVLWRLLEHLWPKLRAAFSCCTFSLQQRALEEGPFDLLFAPSAVYSRFTKLSPEHLIEPGTGRKSPPSEAWADYWAEALFAPRRSMPLAENELPIWNELGEDPTAVRKLSLIQELRHRAPQSATAGVGAIDVVESLAHEPTDAVEFKRVVLADAIEAASTAAPEEALMSLRLIEDRLRRDSFRAVSDDFGKRLSAATARVTTRDPEAALQSGGAWLANSITGAHSDFAHGIISGLRDLATQNPARLEVLRAHPEIAAEIFRLEPTFAATYLQVGGGAAPGILSEWLTSTRDFETLRLVRKSVLPLLEQGENAQLLTPLLRDLRANEVSEALAVLFKVTEGFAHQNVQNIVGDQISSAYPDVVRRWASESEAWSPGLAVVVASTYPQSRQGFDELLNDGGFVPRRKAEVLAAAIRAQIGYGHPHWLREIISNDVRLVRLLLLTGSETTEAVESVLPLLLNEAELPLAKDDEVLDAILSFSDRSVFSQLIDAAMRSLITCYVVEGRDSQMMRKLEGSPQSYRWLQSVSAARLTDLLVQACYAGQHAVARAWMWSARAPRSLYERRSPVLPGLCDALLRFSYQSFPEGMEESLLQVLRRASSESDHDVRHSLSAKMLRFAFDHTGFPLGGVVAETFADAYAVAVEEDHRSSSIFSVLFGSYNWDRGKDLRISLIDTFLRSNWRPGDLALAASNAGILRKIFKRLRRRYEGDNYINSIVRDLNQRNDQRSATVREDLETIVNAPNFYEDWD